MKKLLILGLMPLFISLSASAQQAEPRALGFREAQVEPAVLQAGACALAKDPHADIDPVTICAVVRGRDEDAIKRNLVSMLKEQAKIMSLEIVRLLRDTYRIAPL